MLDWQEQKKICLSGQRCRIQSDCGQIQTTSHLMECKLIGIQYNATNVRDADHNAVELTKY